MREGQMRCKDVERLISDFSWEIRDGDEVEKIKHHIDGCPKCAAFEAGLELIRFALQQLPSQTASEELFEQTRSRSHAIVTEQMIAKRKVPRPAVPKWIWASFSVLLGLTGVLMLPLAAGIDLTQPLNFPKVAVIVLALQNLIMLFFSPVLFQRIRFPRERYKNDFMPPGPHGA